MALQDLLNYYGVSSIEDLRKLFDLNYEMGTKTHYENKWNQIKGGMPPGILFGPLLILSKRNCLSNILTKIAFWLLRKAKWKLVKGE